MFQTSVTVVLLVTQNHDIKVYILQLLKESLSNLVRFPIFLWM